MSNANDIYVFSELCQSPKNRQHLQLNRKAADKTKHAVTNEVVMYDK